MNPSNADLPPADDRAIPWRVLLALLALALGVRVVWALLIPVVPESDSHAYDVFSRTLAQHGVFGWTKEAPLAFWPPGTSMVYAALYWLAGFDYVNIVAFNLLLGVALVLYTVRVATRFHGAPVGLWSGMVIALWPTMVMLTTLMVSELLFLVLTLAALDLWTRPGRRLVWSAMAAGLLLGAASLVRPIAMLLPVVFAGALWLQAGLDRQVFRAQTVRAIIASLALASVVAPWTWRNYQLYGAFIPVSTNGGALLWMGNSPASDGSFIDFPPELNYLNDHERDVILGARARAYIAADPLGFVLRSGRKLVFLYNNESIAAHWNSGGIEHRFGKGMVHWFKRFTQVTWAVIFLTALAGTWIAMRRLGAWRIVTSPLVAMGVYFSVVHAVVLTGDRYHLVSAGAVASMAGFALVSLVARARRIAPAR